MTTRGLLLTSEGLARLTKALRERGVRVIGPVETEDARRKKATEYREIDDADQLALGDALPRLSLKELFLPPTESLFRWSQDKERTSIESSSLDFRATVVLGAFPCDAAALPILDRVMGWDYVDEPWFARRRSTTIVARACSGRDASCFCGLVGLDPRSSRGADVLLSPAEDGHSIEILTPKGEELIARHADIFETTGPSVHGSAAPTANIGVHSPSEHERLPTDEPAVASRMDERADSPRREASLDFDMGRLRARLEESFDSRLWTALSYRCHGCGACAAVCPTCHCFDIVDEPEGTSSGVRRRNWDTCQSSMFTLHGSGHNPRPTQESRCRQRMMHKFAIYPKRFEEILCTGCGRCSRVCSAGMNLLENLRAVAGSTKEGPTGEVLTEKGT